MNPRHFSFYDKSIMQTLTLDTELSQMRERKSNKIIETGDKRFEGAVCCIAYA